MKMLAKKLLVILSTFLLFVTSSNVLAISQFLSDEFVNLGVVLELTSQKETVLSGQYHKISVKNSYANPNDEDYATCKIYLTDGQNNPNNVVQLQGMVENKIVFSCENNEDLSVTVELKEEKNEEEIVTARYLEYILPPGTSVEMELEFLVPNGISGKEQTLVLMPEVTHKNAQTQENDKVTENLTVKWTSEFKWENLQKTSSVNSIAIDADNKLSKDITYNFSANNSTKTTGNIWTRAITITDTLTLPDGLSVPNNITYSDSKKEIYTENELLYAITLPENINITDYEVNELKAENNQIKFSITIYNPNKTDGILTSDFNPFDGLSTTLYSKQINVQRGHIFNGEEKINNSINAVFMPYCQDEEEITLNATKDVNMEKDTEQVTLKKTVQPIVEGKTCIDDILKYTITIENTGRTIVEKDFEDTLPTEITLTEESIQSLQEQGFTVVKVETSTNEETYKISKKIQIDSGNKNTIEFLAKIVTDKQTIVVNTAKYGNLLNSASIEINKDILKLEKKQIKKWKNYATYNYSYPVSDERNPAFPIIGEGDRIEYEITLTNNSNKDRTVTLQDELPEGCTYNARLGNFYKYAAGTMKFYLAGYEGQEFNESNNNKGFIDHLQSYSQTGPNGFAKVMVVDIPAKTTLTQTFIVDVPTGNDYIKILDGLRYNLSYLFQQNSNDATNDIYNVIYVYENPNINSKVYHKVEPRFYVQKGVAARNHLDDFEAGVALTNANKDLHKYAYSEDESYINDEVITFYAYFVNDSVYDLDLSQTTIYDYLPKGLEFLGLNTIEDQYKNENSDLIPSSSISRFKLSPISERITTKANSYPLLWVNDERANEPYDKNSSYPINSSNKNFEKDNIDIVCHNMGQTFSIDASGRLKSGQGFYILYSCKVNSKQANGVKLENSITWNLSQFYGMFYNNYYEKARMSDATNVISYRVLNNPNLSNDGKCIDGLQGPYSISSEVTLEPEKINPGIEERYGNICIKKVDEAGKQIKLSEDDSISFEILNESQQPLNFTEKSIDIEDYKTKYAGKYYWYEETSSDTTVTQLTTNAGLSIKNLPIGKYYIRETKAPNNYELSTKLVPFTIKAKYEEGEDNGIYDSDFRLLYGLGKEIKFENKYSGNKLVYIEKIDADTKQVITHDETKFSVYLSSEESNPVEFVKLNADTNGNHYRLATNQDSSKTTELITHNGKIQLEDLEIGIQYYIKETEAPFGYVKDNSYKTVLLTSTTESDNISKKISFENEKNMNDITIIKTDGEDTLIAEDVAKFQLYNSEGEIVQVKRLSNEENNSVYELTDSTDAELTDTIETYRGKIVIQHMPFGMYTLKETKSPNGYILDETGTNINIQSSSSNYEFKIQNGKARGNVKIVKTDTDGEVIESSGIVFKLYDKNNNLVKFTYNNEKSEEGRIYYVSEDEQQNTYTQLTAYKGKIMVKNIPIGDYYLKEMVAPSGYSLSKEKKQFKISPINYITPEIVNVQNADYKFGEEQYVSTSYQKIEEKDNNENYGYGYHGKNSDYSNGNYNYIVVDGKQDIVTYTLKVSNVSKKNYENLVLINKLPDIGDTGAVNQSEARNSEFTVKLAQNPNYQLIQYDKDGEEKILKLGEDYTIEYSDNEKYTDDDWNGIDNENWYETPKDTTKSFRIKFSENFELYSGYSISLKFDGNIQNNANPGQIAWNSFGYRYYVGSISLTPEPPKVGVKIPYQPIITKTMTDNSEDMYYFDIYEEGNAQKITTIEVKAGTSAIIPAKRTINGETSGYLEDGKTYIIKEQTNKIAKLSSVVGERGEVKESSFEFTYDKEQETKVNFTNEPLKDAKIIITKIDKETKAPLENAKFKLLNTQDETIKVKKIEDSYILSEDNNEQDNLEELITDSNGEIKINNLPFGTYKIKEIEAPDRYKIGEETTYTINITPEDYIIEDGIVVNVPKQLQVENQIIRGKVIVHHYIEGTNQKVPSKNEGEVQDETIVDVVKEPYTTEKSDQIAPNYEFVSKTDNYEGTITEETQEVTYYYKMVDATNQEDKVETQEETKENLKFNLKLDKQILEVQKDSKAENIDSNKMHKVVINRKQTGTSTIKVKYSIKVKNAGTLIGEGIIEEKLPEGMEFIAKESDSKWYVEDNKIKAKTGSLNPKEEITLNIVAKWEGKNNIYGTLKNTAEITNTKNEAGLEEETTKDNKDGAILIIEISTGGETYIIMAFATLLLLLAIVRVLYKNKRN